MHGSAWGPPHVGAVGRQVQSAPDSVQNITSQNVHGPQVDSCCARLLCLFENLYLTKFGVCSHEKIQI